MEKREAKRNMVREICTCLLALLSFLCLAAVIVSIQAEGAQTDTVETKTRYVDSTDGLYLRKTCSTRDTILAVLPYGAQVTQTETIGLGGAVWSHLEYDGITGYARAEFLSDEDPLEDRVYMGKWNITAYAYTGSPCANGAFPEIGYTVACNSLPFGTVIYIDGIGTRTVEDRGPSSMGDAWCDLYLGDEEECIRWGNQQRDVWVMEDKGNAKNEDVRP